jgi:tRNA-specific 2-thiouridylase
MSLPPRTIVALSGGVDSAVAALLLQEQGHAVECLHMSNWDDDDGYCEAAADLEDARAVCDRLGLPLHRVNFAAEYRREIFADFLREARAGRTPNPDVLCNRKIKFGQLKRYALRLGADFLATGHYARLAGRIGQPILLKGRDRQKDQSYFLHAVDSGQLTGVLFPLGEYLKADVRRLAEQAGLPVADKRDSTGICFIGERPYGEFLARFVPRAPGPIVTESGERIGEHEGLAFYTIGQRKGLKIGGVAEHAEAPWYVAAKNAVRNELVVVQGHSHPALHADRLRAGPAHWIGPPPADWSGHGVLRCLAKTRYRQADQPCLVTAAAGGAVEVAFDSPQRALTPGQYAVFYAGDRCLGGARIEAAGGQAFPAALAAGAR